MWPAKIAVSMAVSMKLKTDPRHLKRIKLMQQLFTWNFFKKRPPKKISEIIINLQQIDDLIGQCAKDRPINQINRIDLAILRLAIFELIINKGVPPKVAIDEAVELGKEFGSDSSGAFINGTLGQVVKLKGVKI